MQKKASIFSVAQTELFSRYSIVLILPISIVYVLFTLFLLNYRLVIATIAEPFPLENKVTVLTTLLGGLFTAFSPIDTSILIVSSLLVGINLLLMAKTLYVLEHSGKVKVSLGGATLLGIISTGCSSCGFSVLSILGLGASLSFLPFHGMELHILSLGLLLFSTFYMLKKLRESKYCKTN